jgi:uncharacterized protein (DUF1800 family)
MRCIGTLVAVVWLAVPTIPLAQQSLAQDQRIAHVLNRLGYGLRAGDVDRVRTMGIEAYLDAQLHPERIADPLVDAKLAQYAVLRGTLESLMEYDRPAAAIAVRRREPVIRKAFLAEQASKDGRPGAETPDADSAAAMRRALHNATASGMVTRADRPRAFEEVFGSRILRAVYSERQLQEVMVDFWFNHFNINVGDPYLVTHWTEQVIRPHALGKFEDLLVATATHPAMMIYLDNWLSAAPDSVITERLAKWQPPDGENRELAVRRRMDFFERTKGLNENYGRELMELHTLGVDGGYTQKDVGQVARAFTGWTLSGPREDGTFVFEPLIHEEGDKVVLGRTIKAGGMDEGLEILRLLARHPSTARFVSFKLARRFVADDPPAAVVEAAARTFTETRGDIRAVLRTIFTSPDFFSPAQQGSKIKKPLEMVVSALRAVSADIDFSLEPTYGALTRALREMGEPLGQHEAPDGYPDVGSAWVSTNTLYQRMSFSLALTSGQLPGIRVDPDAAARLFHEMGYGDPTPGQITQAQALLARRAALGAGGAAAGMMMADEAPKNDMGMRKAKAGGANAAAGAPPSVAELKAIATAIHLGSPQFQKR